MAVRIRTVSEQERAAIQRLARSRTGSARLVERAPILEQAVAGQRVPAIAEQLGLSEETVRLWLKRFNAAGLDGLADHRRAGRPPTYTAEQVGEVVAAALTDPQRLGLPFGSWTLDRLAGYLAEQHGIPIKRSRIDEVLAAEGLRWRTQETWFGERAGGLPATAVVATPAESAPTDRDGGAATATPTKGQEARPVDPAFAQKRGPSKRSPRPRLQTVS